MPWGDAREVTSSFFFSVGWAVWPIDYLTKPQSSCIQDAASVQKGSASAKILGLEHRRDTFNLVVLLHCITHASSTNGDELILCIYIHCLLVLNVDWHKGNGVLVIASIPSEAVPIPLTALSPHTRGLAFVSTFRRLTCQRLQALLKKGT